LGQRFVGFLKLVDFTFRLTNGGQEGAIGLLPSQKFPDHFLNVCYLCGVFNSFESFINGRALFHFLFHLFAHELVPKLRNEQLVAQHQLSTVFVLIRGRLSNLCVFALAFNSSVYGLLFIFDRLLKL
jgi:hypothetical protein